jgi:hypothetical protein
MHTDSRLEDRIIAAARGVQKSERKTPESVFLQRLRSAAQRSLVEDWPRDANGSPIDDDFAGPIG